METPEPETLFEGQAEAWRYMFAFSDSMAVKCALELRIPDIIHSHGSSMTISQIASAITTSKTVDISYLSRMMRFLARRKIFTSHSPSDGSETLYGLNQVSKWFCHDFEYTLAPFALMENHPWAVAPWHFFSNCVKEGGIAFKKAHGCEIWEFGSKNPEFNNLFNSGLASTSRVVIRAILTGYKDGFRNIGSLVDVGGGTGELIAQIVKEFPHIRGTNFDLAHVVATAPVREGVTHVGGDMFEEIPCADALILKWILHDWDDNDCVKILKNCRKAMEGKNGKLIIVEVIVEPEGTGDFGDTCMVLDLLMIAHTTGKERTEAEWRKLLEEAGFSRYNVIKIPTLPSVIEAFPE